MSSDLTAPQTAFGIGCFHFGIRKEPPFIFSGQQYIDELTRFISAVPSIESLSLNFDDEFSGSRLNTAKDEKIPSMIDGGTYFPVPLYGVVSFVVRIPYRVQSLVLDTPEKFLDTHTEDFFVQIRYAYYWPVVFVQPLGITPLSDPSTGVRVVREFLKSEFSKVSSEWIRFEYLGPSPYHVRCYLLLRPETPDDLGTRIVSTRTYSKGYDRIDFFYDTNSVEDEEEAIEVIFEDIEDDISLFYLLTHLYNARASRWGELRTSVSELINIQKRSGWRSHWERLSESQALINQIFIDLADFESNDMGLESFVRAEYETSFASELSVVFKADVRKRWDEKSTYPTHEIARLIQFFEDRRNRAVETLAVIVAAILGGIVGSSITILFTSGA